MPFTLSHAAAVLPAVRRDGTGRGPLRPAALIAGSFAPDMTFYAASVLPEGMEFGSVTHSFAGVFTVDVLISWALVGLWLLVREPLLALLPRVRQGRPAALLRCGAPHARAGAVSVVWWHVSAALGALTHVGWDAFTHDGRWGTRLIPAIERDRLAGLPLFSWLQYGSSVVGAVLIVVFAARAVRRAPGGEPVGVPVLSVRDRWLAGAVIGGCAAAGAGQRAARLMELRREAAPARAAAGDGWASVDAPGRLWDLVPTLCFGAGAGLVLGLLLYAACVRVWRPGRVPDGPGGCGDPHGVVGADPERPVAR
ncbi:DUF4184 family protein [Streptomyces sp. NPDC052101]|uniref:DUF4184 family protein n=1 Tax=Streptomyces sp. NPDC052101 TaxID=3155763 RepID=UPI003432A4A9